MNYAAQTPSRSRPSILIPRTIDRAHLKGWQLTYLAGGRPFNVFVRARNQSAADEEGRIELGRVYPEFGNLEARLTVCVEVH